MASFDEDVHTLTRLGLTVLQAKVYLSLIKTGRTTTKKISASVCIARQEVQRVTGELQKLGMVEKIIANPTEFSPLPINDVISSLVENRNKASLELEEKTKKLLSHYQHDKLEIQSEDETNFVITTGRDAIINKSRIVVERITKSCDIVNGLWKNVGYASTLFKKQNIDALKRNVKIRIIAQELPQEQSVQKIYQHSIQDPNFEIRFVPSVSAIFGIYDKRELLVYVSPYKLIGDSPMLWTNNPTLIEIAQAYFDRQWARANRTHESFRSQKRKSMIQTMP